MILDELEEVDTELDELLDDELLLLELDELELEVLILELDDDDELVEIELVDDEELEELDDVDVRTKVDAAGLNANSGIRIFQ